jgi:hypothetical protein
VLITFKSSESSKEVNPGSIEAFANPPLLAIANVKHCTLSFSRSYPHHGQFFRPLTSSASVSRPYDATMSLRHLFPQSWSRRRDPTSWPCWAPCCLHQIPGWLNDRYSPAAVIKGNPLPRTADAKAPFPSELDIITVLVLLPASLGYTATRPKEEFKPSCHPWPVFGRARVISLDVNRDVSLYRRRNMSAISCACAHSSPASSWTAMR